MGEFLDRMLYTEGLEDEWELFLQDKEIRSLVCVDFQKYEQRQLTYQDWKNLIQESKRINKLESIQFII